MNRPGYGAGCTCIPLRRVARAGSLVQSATAPPPIFGACGTCDGRGDRGDLQAGGLEATRKSARVYGGEPSPTLHSPKRMFFVALSNIAAPSGSSATHRAAAASHHGSSSRATRTEHVNDRTIPPPGAALINAARAAALRVGVWSPVSGSFTIADHSSSAISIVISRSDSMCPDHFPFGPRGSTVSGKH